MFSAAILAQFEKDHDVRIADLFDMIVGTSTGGILAIGLGLGMEVSALRDLYVNNGARIFPPSFGRRARHWCRAKYSPDALEATLKGAFGAQKLGDSKRALVMPYYNLGKSQPSNFKTRHHPRFTQDHKLPAWQVAMGTAAAPTYFPASRNVERSRHIDGGVWANNPALVGAIEAYQVLGVPFESMRILSIGTAQIVREWKGDLDNAGKAGWGTSVADLLIGAQGQSASEMVRLLVGKERVHRINPTVPESWGSLDKVQTDEFLSRGYSEAMTEGEVFRDLFLGHTALNLDDVFALGAAHAVA